MDFGTFRLLGFWTWHFLTTQKAKGNVLTIENIALLCIHCIAFFDNLECPGNFVTTKNAKTFSTIKNAEGNSLTTKNAKRNFLTIKSAKAIFGILRFRPGNQALEAQGDRGTSCPKEPGPASPRSKPPIALEHSENPSGEPYEGKKEIQAS